MADSVALAVQVVNYRTRAYLDRCLASVVSDLERSGVDFEVNVLDNASGDDLSDLEGRFPACRTFVATRNLGFGGGHNLLAQKTGAAHLLILNPDVELLFADTSKRLLDVVTSSDRVKAAGPKVVMSDGRAQPYDHGRVRGLRAQIALRGGHSYWRETDTDQEVAWVSGAALMTERAAFESIGGFDENLFLYKEDEDLCLRLRHAGGQVIYLPTVVVRHRGSVVADRTSELPRAASYFSEKHFPNRRSRKLFAAAHAWLAYLGR